jgi:hypothetical protein
MNKQKNKCKILKLALIVDGVKIVKKGKFSNQENPKIGPQIPGLN